MVKSTESITHLLQKVRKGSEEAYQRLFSMVYDELHKIAYWELKRDHPLNTISKTSLVHEAYIKLAGGEKLECENRAHFFALAARAMRFIMIDYARKKTAEKRGGHLQNVTYIDELIKVTQKAQELVDLDEALDKLGELNERLVKIIELRYFGQMSIEDTAEVLDLSPRTVNRDWAKAKGWLFRELNREMF